MSGCKSWITEHMRFLVVEDDEVDRLALIRSLRAATDSGLVQIEFVDSVSAALLILRSHTFDCVLLDYQLPDGDAFLLLNEWHKSGGIKSAIVLLTGLAEESLAIQALRKGVQDYLVKGNISEDALCRSIRYAVERFRIQRHLERSNEQLERLAFLDPLTEVLNRRGLEHLLTAEVNRASRDAHGLFVVLIDCDNFKGINDTHGHDVGDIVLREISNRIRSAVRTSDHFGRIGGDEFLIFLPRVRHEEALRLAERIRQAVGDRPFLSGNEALHVTISLAVTSVPPEATSITDLLAHIDTLLRRSKQSGKDRISSTWPRV